MASRSSIGVGLIGFGTIGTGVVKVLRSNARSIEERIGRKVKLVRVGDLDTKTDRGVKLGKGVLVPDARAVIEDPAVDVVVELIGGMEPARSFHREALAAGKAVVTANKALLSEHGPELAAEAERRGLPYGFEASVGGGIPILRTLREALAGDRNLEIYGLLNGTANYVLTEMASGAGEFGAVLADAQRMGLAEADPSYDVDGIDSLQKLVVLVAMAFGKRIRPKDVYCEGIRALSGVDMSYAREFGYTIKLLAVARESRDGIEAHVHPTMVPNSHLLAQVSGAYNAVCVEGKALGQSIYYGQGAGMMPTSTAVVADVVDAARVLGGDAAAQPAYGRPAKALERAKVLPMDRVSHEQYVRFGVRDEPGALAMLAKALGDRGISIATVAQHETAERGVVPVVVRTHQATDAALGRALAKIERMAGSRRKPVVIRVEEELGGGQ